jgi:hypothetical protein
MAEKFPCGWDVALLGMKIAEKRKVRLLNLQSSALIADYEASLLSINGAS